MNSGTDPPSPPPREEGADLPGFPPSGGHLLLMEFYGDHPHHNNGAHLYWVIEDDTVWQLCWCRLARVLASWYDMPQGAVGYQFMELLVEE